MYGFFAKGIRKINSASKTSTNVSSDDWSQVLFKCAVNFENHCYLHSANAIWYVNLNNGSFRKIDSNKWEGSTALIPVPNNEIGFKSRSQGRMYKLIDVGRNETSVTQTQEYTYKVGGTINFKIESTVEAGLIFTKASLTVGVETSTESSTELKKTLTVPAGKSVALYQAYDEYDIFIGIKE